MKNVVLVLLFVFLLVNPLYSQKIKIVKVHNTNLFELEDGTLIKLAGVDALSKNHPDSTLRDLTEEIISFAKMKFLYGLVDIQYSDTTHTGKNFKYAYLSRGNLFYNVDFNELYLEYGYGKFIDNVDSTHRDIFIQAEREAKENFEGIWRFKWISENDALDNSNVPFKMNELKPEWQHYYDRSAGRIALEIVAGPVTGYLAAIASGYIAAGIGTAIGGNAFGHAIYGAGIGYIAGNSLGVYFVAKGGNKDLSIWWTLLSGVVGTSVGGGIAYLMQETDYGWIPGVAGITLGPVIYANLIAPPPSRNEEDYSRFKHGITEPYSHRDLYNSTMIFQQDLVRINF